MPAWARPEEPMTPVPATPSLRVAAPLLLALVLSLPSATGTASAAARDLAGRAPALEATLPSRAASATAYDPLWTGYPLPNAAGTVYAMVPFAGGMAMGGDVRYWGTTYSNRVALWDGATWQALGDGVPGTVRALAVYDGKLVAGCESDGRVYTWDGVSWTLIGDADNPVRALLVDGTDLYVGGSFFNIDGVPATFLARWDGAAWHQAGTNLNRPRQSGGGIYPSVGVRALARVGADLYAGGQLPGYEGIARWDGVAWSTTGAGLQSNTNAGSVDALTTDGTTLYAAGTFNTSGGSPLTRIAAWNGASWSGVPGATVASSALAVFGGQLVGTVPDAGLSRPQLWNGSVWNPYNHPNVIPQGYGVDGSGLYASGGLSQSSGATPTFLGGFYHFDGSAWSPVQQAWAPDMKGISIGSVSCALEYQGSLFVGGSIGYYGTGDHFVFSPGVGRWDGTDWNTVATGAGGQYFDMAVWADSLVAAVDGSVKIWNGSSWRRLAPIQNQATFDWTSAVATAGGQLYVLGAYFVNATSTELNLVGRWTGSAWVPVGGGISDPAGYVDSGTEWNGQLVVCGAFSSAGGVAVRNLARWDGAAWQGIGGGADGEVYTVIADGGDLVVGGSFTEVGGEAASSVARWDGSVWHAMGTEAVVVNKLRAHAGRIYAVGRFLDDAQQPVDGVAVWTGARWRLLGSGIGSTGSLNSLAFLGDDLYIVGSFGVANGHPTRGFARLPDVSTLDVPAPGPGPARLALAPSPNPSRGGVRLAVTLPAAGRVRLVIHDVSGREVARLLDGEHAAGAFSLAWDARVAPGLYFATLDGAGERATTRIVRLK